MSLKIAVILALNSLVFSAYAEEGQPSANLPSAEGAQPSSPSSPAASNSPPSEGDAEATGTTETSGGVPESTQTKEFQSSNGSSESLEKNSKQKKERVAREKEADGTQAPRHFDSDNIIKSKYELNGQPLEVDTD